MLRSREALSVHEPGGVGGSGRSGGYKEGFGLTMTLLVSLTLVAQAGQLTAQGGAVFIDHSFLKAILFICCDTCGSLC